MGLYWEEEDEGLIPEALHGRLEVSYTEEAGQSSHKSLRKAGL